MTKRSPGWFRVGDGVSIGVGPERQQSDSYAGCRNRGILAAVEPLAIRPFGADEAAAAAGWAYEHPFDLYNSDPSNARLFLEVDADGFGYYALADAQGVVVGFCCFGAEARVPPQTPQEGTIDLGGGIRPDRLSEGVATATLPAVMAFALRWNPRKFRVAVAGFNVRSIRLCQSAGFKLTRSFQNREGRDFLELERMVKSSGLVGD